MKNLNKHPYGGGTEYRAELHISYIGKSFISMDVKIFTSITDQL